MVVKTYKDCMKSVFRWLSCVVSTMCFAWIFAGCRMMDGASGLMMVSADTVGLGSWSREHTFGPWIVSDGFSLSKDVVAEKTFAYRNPDGYDIALRGMKRDSDGTFVPDVELFPEEKAATYQYLNNCQAEFEVVISQEGKELVREVVRMDDILAPRCAGSRVYNHYALYHLDRSVINAWKDCVVLVRVIKGASIPMPSNIKLQLIVTGNVVL